MYLKKVEIRGFKSFGDLVKLNIQPGITAVVGPNGCGKSNIADAMRWVLGEQSAKLLRGERMQDVIFSGTQNRKGVGYAQVSMTIDNSEGKLQIDYSEVVITRRVYRSGESEYLINQSPCRLKDIHEVFMGTGVGKEGYSIIGQGQIDKVLSSKPDDRRNLFEEAAGIYKYKLRKIETEKKLEKKQENLIRVQDILSEVESRLETLEKQAYKAKKYMAIRDELKEFELNIFIYEADKIEKELTDLTGIYDTLQDDFASNNASLEKTKKAYDQIRAKLTALQEESAIIQNDIMDIRMKIEQIQGNTKVNQERIRAIDENIKRQKDDDQKRKLRYKEQEDQKEVFETRQIDIQNKIKKEEVFLGVLENDFNAISNQVILEEEKIENHKNTINQGLTRISNMETAIESGDTLSEQIDHRHNQIKESSRLIESEMLQQETRYKVLDKNQGESNLAYEKLLGNLGQLEASIESLGHEQNTVDQLHRRTEDLYHKSYSRHKALTQMINEYEGFYRSVKNILNLKDKNPHQWANICGVVGELIKVPQNLETAIDVALGNSIQHIITKDEQTANLVIEYIKKHDLGRATFLPLSAVKTYQLGADGDRIPKEPGVVGFANDLISYDTTYADVISNLLGRVVIVDHMKNAIALARKYRYRYRIVTLDGEILNPGGSITGGNFHKNKGNIFSRDREVGELLAQINRYKGELASILDRQKDLGLKKEEALSSLKTYQANKADLEKLLMEIRMEADHVQGRLRQLESEKKNLHGEKEDLDQRYHKMHDDLHNNEQLINDTRLHVEALKNQLQEMLIKAKEIREEKEAMAGRITDLKISLSSKKEILNASKDQIQRLEEEMQGGSLENLSYEAQIKDHLHNKQVLIDQTSQLKEDITKQKGLLEIENDKLAQVTSQIKTYTLDEIDQRKEQDQIVEKSSLLQNEIYRIENKVSKLNLEKETIFAKVWEKYEATYQSAQAFKKDLGTITDLRKVAGEYKSKIKSLGIINTGAIEEFDEIKERYEFMKGHEQDIIEAEKTLLKLIDNLTESMEVIFKEEFQKISDNFNIVFTELFGGGQAFLELTDTDDVLESGIEIIAQPPGKKLQNMMLLSGGERALTAIAILFGILRLKPSPFAILDEIEAALDDANVVRFSNYLKVMGENMQFLVITHRKGTMAVADTIYGVTMEEKGVSKVISVQLDEATDYSGTE